MLSSVFTVRSMMMLPMQRSPLIQATPIRTMATLRDIQTRLKSIKNIAKITKSMKMIASTKLSRAQKTMEVGRVFAQSARSVFQHVRVPEATSATTTTPVNSVVITCSSDKGLCGAIHSAVSKMSKRILREQPTTRIVVLGDKAKSQLAREYRKQIYQSFSQVGRATPTFLDALVVARHVFANVQPEQGLIIYNRFKSVIAYEASSMPLITVKSFEKAENLGKYELEEGDTETYQHFIEFQLATALYWALVEGHASEMSARRTAMENATKNAGEIIGALTMRYNRTRQAVITNELVDIITGASAL